MQNNYLIPTEKLTERLQFENPWWHTGKIANELENLPRRLYFKLFFPLVKEVKIKRALVLMGPRRVGKTVMMHHAIDALITENISKQKIAFISIDNPIYINQSLESLLQLTLQAAGIENPEGCFIFFDEIQYLKNWEQHLKTLVDSYPNTKFIVSGSAAAALRLKSSESGAGRFTDFLLPPLTFQEYIHLKGLQHLLKPKTIIYNNSTFEFFESVNIKTLNEHFINYINFGGYPEVIFSETIQQNMSRYIKSDIIDKVLLRDLPSLYGIKDVQELNRFFAYLAYNTGKEFSFEKMSVESGLDKTFLKKYLEYLEAAFLIHIVNKVDDTAKSFRRITAFKIYLTNTSLRSALFSPVNTTESEVGNLVETAIFSQWMHRENINLKYASWKTGRTQGEVDMVNINDSTQKPHWCVEIKWSNRFPGKLNELKSLMEFCSKNNLASALVTTIDNESTADNKGIQLLFVPAAVYAYVVGDRTLRQKLH